MPNGTRNTIIATLILPNGKVPTVPNPYKYIYIYTYRERLEWGVDRGVWPAVCCIGSR